MWTVFYAWVFALPALWATVRRRHPEAEPIALAATAILLVLFLGFRENVGEDWHAYQIIFARVERAPFFDGMVITDPIYGLLNKVASEAGAGIALVNLACGALLVTGILALCRGLPAPAVGLVVACPVLILVVGLNATRQSAAIGAELWALSLYLLRRERTAAAALLLACGLHWSAVVLLPLGAHALVRTTMPRFAAVLLWSGGAAIVLLAIIIFILFHSVLDLEASRGAAYRLVPSIVAAGIFYRWKRVVPSDEHRSALHFLAALVGSLVIVLIVSPMIADRLGYYTIALQMMVFGHLPAILPHGRQRAPAICVTVVSFVTMFIFWSAFSSYGGAPYRTFLGAAL